MEALISENAFLRPSGLNQNVELQNALLNLRELQYLSRYGDYVKTIPGQVCLHASQTKFKDWELPFGQHKWTEISRQLTKENQDWKDALKRGPSAMNNVRFDMNRIIETACEQLGFSTALVKWSIQLYAERNQAFHKDFEWFKQIGDFQQYAKVLYDDLHDIDCVFSQTRSSLDRQYLETVIRSEIDRLFDTSIDANNPRVWQPKAELVSAYHKANEEKGGLPRATSSFFA